MRSLALLTVAAALVPGRLPGAHAVPICAAAGPYWPATALAVQDGRAWVACKEQSRVLRVDVRSGKVTANRNLSAPVVAVATGFGSVWALDVSGTLHRLRPDGRVLARIPLHVTAGFGVWAGGGSIWVADDQAAEVVRVSPRTNRVVARPTSGDGPAAMAFTGASAWVLSHRDRVLTRIDLRTSTARRVAVLPGDAPERMVFARGRLWVTGRGTDLLVVDPARGSVERTIEIGASGIDLVVCRGSVWIPVRSNAVDRQGLPTMAALVRVSLASGSVSVVSRARGRLDVHGLRAAGSSVLIADTTAGLLYRVP